MTVLKPGDAIASPVDGVTLTGIGYVDGRLHVQAYYADILKTDNHGSISLVNRETGEQIDCDGSAAFFDSKRAGSYEDYIFTGIEADTLDTYALYGMFVTSTGPVEGNWSVTFPLENTTMRLLWYRSATRLGSQVFIAQVAYSLPSVPNFLPAM